MERQKLGWLIALLSLGIVGGTALLLYYTVVERPPGYRWSFGELGSRPGQLYDPTGVVVDRAGNIYVTDSGNHRIEKFSGSGALIATWGEKGSGPGQFLRPFGLTLDPDGDLLVTDNKNHRIQNFTPQGLFLGEFGSNGEGEGEFAHPTQMGIDRDGTLFVADTYNHRIQKFSRDPERQKGMGGGGEWRFKGVWGSRGSGLGQLNAPWGVAIDSTGTVYVADSGNDRIQKFSNKGEPLDAWGFQGSGAGQFDHPTFLLVDRYDFLYVVDEGNNRIQKFTKRGEFVHQWGRRGSGHGEFLGPRGIFLTDHDRLLAADSGNNRIQLFQVFRKGIPPTEQKPAPGAPGQSSEPPSEGTVPSPPASK